MSGFSFCAQRLTSYSTNLLAARFRFSFWVWILMRLKRGRQQTQAARIVLLARVQRVSCRWSPSIVLFVSIFGERFSSHVFAGVRSSWHNLLSGSEHFVSAHYDVSVASGWKTSAPNLPNGQLLCRVTAQGRLRVARRFPKSFSSL